MANSVDPDQTAPIGAVCSGSMLIASLLYSSVMLGNYLQQTTSADNIFRCIFFLGALRANTWHFINHSHVIENMKPKQPERRGLVGRVLNWRLR